MNKIIKTISKILHYGQLESMSHTQNRKILNVNSASLIAIISALLYSLNLLIFINSDVAMINLIAASPFLILYLTPIWLNYHYHHKCASWMISALITASVACSIWVISGTFFNLHYYFILFAIVPLLFFSSKDWYASLLFYFINIGFFVKIEYFGVDPWWTIEQPIDPESQFYLQASSVTVSLLTLWFITFLSEQAAQLNEERLENLSDHDPLTGLANRRCFEQNLARALKVARRNHELGSVMFMDLDNFKPLNDTHGHIVGDLLLKEVSSRISKTLRESDLVARFGGDEFVVLFPPSNTETSHYREHIDNVARKIQHILSQPFYLKDHRDEASKAVSHVCTASIGVTFYNHADNMTALIERADKAMYQAKRQGKNQIFVIS
jgi:diguanylate cyclase (GGDEF)-like protein